MSVQNKPDYKIFADGAKPGEVVSFPDVSRGWGVTLDTTGGVPPMEFFNSFGKRLNEWLLYLTQRGIPDWDASVDYPSGAVCYDGDSFYVSLKPVKGDKPSTSQSSWSSFGTFFKIDDKVDKSQITNGLVDDRNKVTSSALLVAELKKKQPVGNYQPAGDYALNSELNKNKLPKGMVSFFLHREASLPNGWYSLNGDRYSASSYAGSQLRALSSEIKSDWGITDTGGILTTPNLLQSNGRIPFIRPLVGATATPGVVSGDTMRNINGEFGYESQYGLATNDADVTGVFYRFGPARKSFAGGGTGQTTNIAFSADRVVPTGPEFKPLSVNMAIAIYLGVE